MNKRKILMFMSLVLALVALLWGIDQGRAQTGPNPGVDYTKPNYANSPILRKFVDKLPGLGPTGANLLGQYIPIAAPSPPPPGVPWALTDDYYEIALVEYREQMHSDLPPLSPLGTPKTNPLATGGTKLRGYVQEINGVAVDEPHYLGPLSGTSDHCHGRPAGAHQVYQ